VSDKTKAQKAEQAEAVERLREWVKPGDTLFTLLRHVSKSGMSRTIQIVSIKPADGSGPGSAANRENGVEIGHLGYNVAQALGEPYDRQKEGVKVGGCGMDMGFHLVYSLGSVLFPGGFGCVGEGCQASDHSNGDRDYTPHTSLLGAPVGVKPKKGHHWHKDGGYALRHRWI